jgi:cytochrome c biogenesis protein CcdA
MVLGEAPAEDKNLVVIEYEVYQDRQNGRLMYDYDENLQTGLGIPLWIIGEGEYLKGDRQIKAGYAEALENPNKCLLPNGDKTYFAELNLNSLPQKPKIWRDGRILIKNGGGESDKILKELLATGSPEKILAAIDHAEYDRQEVAWSGKKINFDNSVALNGWIFMWNGESAEGTNAALDANENTEKEPPSTGTNEFKMGKIISLAVVDAVNPCAFAVLILMLTAIIAYNPKNRKNIMLAGLAFVASVFVMYLVYGLVIIKFMKLVQAITNIRLILYKILGGLAIILGVLNIKDFLFYKPGSVGTEMPLSMRPRVKRIISGITSPAGAFGVGAFVTIFLLPCTIGPYLICCGILSAEAIMNSLPPLLIYNLIFVLPMLLIIGIVYLGLRRVEDVSAWKEKNIHKLHLVEGLIMLALGLAMFAGWL